MKTNELKDINIYIFLYVHGCLVFFSDGDKSYSQHQTASDIAWHFFQPKNEKARS